MNTTEILTADPLRQTTEILKENEKKETAINIDGNLDNFNVNNESETVTTNNTQVPNKDVVLDLKVDDDTGKIIIVEAKCADTEQNYKKFKPPAVWVQYNQAHVEHVQNSDQVHVHDQVRLPKQRFGNQGFSPSHPDSGPPLDYDPESRNGFVKLVFSILLVMLIITTGIVAFIFTNENLRELYVEAGLLIMIASLVVVIAMNYVMACSACARVPPCNFISLFIVTIATSNLVAAITVKLKTEILIYALIITIVVVGVCILLACSSFDFTKFYIYVIAIAVVFMVISMMVSISMLVMNIRYKPIQIVLLFVSSIINVVIIIIELQTILGGRAIELNEGDYALGAYLLYTSIVDLFLKIAQMLNLFGDD